MNGTPHNTSSRFVVSLDFIKKGLGDCIPNDRMAEIVARLVAVIPDNVEQDIVRSESPPSDKSKFWYQPSTKKLFVYNPSTNNWDETNVDNISVCISPESNEALTRDEAGCLLLDASGLAGFSENFTGDVTANGSGAATKTLSYATLVDSNATINVAFRDDPGVNGRWWISDQQESSVTISFAGMTVSVAFTVSITATKSE